MADPKWHDLQAINEKVTAYLETHRKIAGDFEHSLRNARHYVELAEVAKDKEPAETVTMLEQIREIDLRGHLQTQFDAFQEISSLLGPEEPDGEQPEDPDNIQELRDRYDLMLEEAEEQEQAITELMLYLKNMA